MLESLFKEGLKYMLVPQVGFALFLFLFYFLLGKILENIFSSDLIGQILAFAIILAIYMFFLNVNLPLMFTGTIAFYLLLKSMYMFYLTFRSIYRKD